MTYKAVVSYISFLDNELKSQLVEVTEKTNKAAISRYFVLTKNYSNLVDCLSWIDNMSEDLEEIKEGFFEGDAMVDVIWIEDYE